MISCEQRLDIVPVRASNPTIKIARNFGCSNRTVRRVAALLTRSEMSRVSLGCVDDGGS
jgi:hypothetical protein